MHQSHPYPLHVPTTYFLISQRLHSLFKNIMTQVSFKTRKNCRFLKLARNLTVLVAMCHISVFFKTRKRPLYFFLNWRENWQFLCPSAVLKVLGKGSSISDITTNLMICLRHHIYGHNHLYSLLKSSSHLQSANIKHGRITYIVTVLFSHFFLFHILALSAGDMFLLFFQQVK